MTNKKRGLNKVVPIVKEKIPICIYMSYIVNGENKVTDICIDFHRFRGIAFDVMNCRICCKLINLKVPE